MDDVKKPKKINIDLAEAVVSVEHTLPAGCSVALTVEEKRKFKQICNEDKPK